MSWFSSITNSVSTGLNTITTKVNQFIEKEQEELSREEKLLKAEKGVETLTLAASPLPWYGVADDGEGAAVKKEILSIVSLDAMSLLQPPPDGSAFTYDHSLHLGAAARALEVDQRLVEARFYLVPAKLKDDEFWRNYFYKLAVIRRKHGLVPMADAVLSCAAEAAEKQQALDERAKPDSAASATTTAKTTGSGATASAVKKEDKRRTLVQTLQGVVTPPGVKLAADLAAERTKRENESLEHEIKAIAATASTPPPTPPPAAQQVTTATPSTPYTTPGAPSGVGVASPTGSDIDHEFNSLLNATPSTVAATLEPSGGPPTSTNESSSSTTANDNDDNWEEELEKELSELNK